MSGDPIAELTTEVLWRAKNDPRAKAMTEAERLAWARAGAESEYGMAQRKAANRAERDRQRAERHAAIADLSAKAGISLADAAEAIRRRKKAERLEGIARAEVLLADESAHHGASQIASADHSADVSAGDPRESDPSERSYPTLQQIEVQRRALAAAGKPHGFDALGGKSPEHPFPGQRSTIRRRYEGLEPPGTWIPDVCDGVPRHQHWNKSTRHPLT